MVSQVSGVLNLNESELSYDPNDSGDGGNGEAENNMLSGVQMNVEDVEDETEYGSIGEPLWLEDLRLARFLLELADQGILNRKEKGSPSAFECTSGADVNVCGRQNVIFG
jgi:hypothetical protein